MTKLTRFLYILCVFLFVQKIPLQAQTKNPSRPLAKGIAEVEVRIAKEKQVAGALHDDVVDHAVKFGEIVYGAYGQERDPAVELIHLKEAYESVHDAVKNGISGQAWPAVGQLGQALLDYGSDLNRLVNHVNVVQQLGWEAGGLLQTLNDLEASNVRIKRDTMILQSLETRSADIAARRSSSNADSTPETVGGSGLASASFGRVDLSALDAALLMNRWLDLGNRAFQDKEQEDNFYNKFPAFRKFRNIAETHSPVTEIERANVTPNPVGPTSPAVRPSIVKGPCDGCPGCSSARDNFFCYGCCSGS